MKCKNKGMGMPVPGTFFNAHLVNVDGIFMGVELFFWLPPMSE